MAGGGRGHRQGPFWGAKVGPNPTDRGKPGTKKSLLVEGSGGPLSAAIAGANVHDVPGGPGEGNRQVRSEEQRARAPHSWGPGARGPDVAAGHAGNEPRRAGQKQGHKSRDGDDVIRRHVVMERRVEADEGAQERDAGR